MRSMRHIAIWSACIIGLCPTLAHAYDVTEQSLESIRNDLSTNRVTSIELVNLYEARIRRLNPALRAVIALNPRALQEAAAADSARRAGRPMGPLAGVPILLKDNIETRDALATTAGSEALKDNVTGRDAPLVRRLRAAGAVILGKTNLSEWANSRATNSISGWSAVGGQVRNPYALDRSPCGSSAGSGAAAAASLAAAAVGTETDGSITCPSAVNGLVGLKPTVGLVSRTYVVPISHSQDTPGPMGRQVRDVALMLQAMAGSDPQDIATMRADAHLEDYAAGLRPDALRGVRIGVMRFATGFHPETERVFKHALDVLRAQGATLIDVEAFPSDRDALAEREKLVLHTELKADLNSYLASTPPERVPTRTLADLIAFDLRNADREMPLFGQDAFEADEKTKSLNDPAYLKAEAEAHQLAGPGGIDKMLADARVTALVAPTLGPAWLIDPVLKDHFSGGGAGSAAAVAGYPHLTVPMGQVDGLPVGLSFIGPAWSEAMLLAYGYAYEQASHARVAPTYAAAATISSEADWQGRQPAETEAKAQIAR